MPFATTNPATGKTEKDFPAHTPAEVDALLQRAVDAFADYQLDHLRRAARAT